MLVINITQLLIKIKIMNSRIRKISFVAITIAVMAFTAASCGSTRGGQGKKHTDDRNKNPNTETPGDRD